MANNNTGSSIPAFVHTDPVPQAHTLENKT
jgi:hypothetical protein